MAQQYGQSQQYGQPQQHGQGPQYPQGQQMPHAEKQHAQATSAYAHAHGAQGKWSFGLFDCCSPFGTCCLATWCPCMLYQKNHDLERGDADSSGCGGQVLVGSDKSEFVIHKNLICASSTFFTRAFAGNFAQGASQQIELPEEKSCLFKFFCDWLYLAEYYGANWSRIPIETEYGLDTRWLLLDHMGDRLIIPGIQVLVLRQFLMRLFTIQGASVPTEEMMKLIYEPDGEKLFRKYITEHVAFWLSTTGNRDAWGSHCKGIKKLGTDLLLELGSKFQGDNRLLSVAHPSERFVELTTSQGLDFEELVKKARLADTKTLSKESSSMFRQNRTMHRIPKRQPVSSTDVPEMGGVEVEAIKLEDDEVACDREIYQVQPESRVSTNLVTTGTIQFVTLSTIALTRSATD
ncbi:uncharacterized protein A1O9_03012 [Exophiala aquamarina CBS 119918]|uniref:BTB domain-containing protein n=1 Tax=Exophiala aquamarina CBS 119918 TaxID=1182545 RepID=A0A072PNI1_9EURO|nr:uncharacterized protein A1O9_03012 [Exophiala aquamarina CBS 119918]KEF61446.1 hypothetical protein A1O9_03012 [Exophiala aquamarina CBS 119918]